MKYLALVSNNPLPNVKQRKCERITEQLWPWTNIEQVMRDNDFTTMYDVEDPNKSPYSGKLALRLIENMFSIFECVRREAITGGGEIPIEISMKLAEKYRGAIRYAADTIALNKKNENVDVFENAVYVANVIWGLVESMFIRPHNRSIVADLIEWANNTFGAARSQLDYLTDLNKKGKRIEEEDCYWEAVINQLLVGQFKAASNLLQMSSDYRRNTQFQRMVALFDLFDYQVLHSEKNSAKFVYAIKQVEKNAANFTSNEPLSFICDMLMGDLQTFEVISGKLSKPWFELLPSYIMFKMPTASIYELMKCTTELHKQIGSTNDGIISDIILDLMKMEWIKSMKTLASIKSMLWISAHLFDLILKTDKGACTEEIEDLRDEVFVQFSKELFKTKGAVSLLRPAVDYMMSTREYKHDAVEPLLTVIVVNDAFQSPELIEEILCLCRENGFFEAQKQINQALAVHALNLNDWQTAVVEACRTEDRQVMDVVSYFVMVTAQPNDLKNCIDLDAFESTVTNSDMMLYLYHFTHFNKAQKRGDIMEMTKLLHQIVVSNLAPREFVQILFDNIAQILEAANKGLNKSLLSVDAILSLQRCFAVYQKQCEVRAVGSSIRLEECEKLNRQLTYLHSALASAQAQTAP